MQFRAADLHELANAEEVRVETRVSGGPLHATVVWIVVDGDAVYVRSIRGAAGRWYQEAVANPQVTIDDRGRRLDATAAPIQDEATIERVSGAFSRKYAADADLSSVLAASALQATLRLDPRSADEVPLEAPAGEEWRSQPGLGPPVDVGMLDSGSSVDEEIVLQPRKPD